MTDSRLERYKEALRLGHVAVLRGRLTDALAAYRAAALIGVDRAAPRTAIGGVHMRLGDPEAALSAYDEALGLARDDDGALNGRAQALAALDRPADAALALDQLAEVRAAAGKLAEALDALRQALDLEPTGVRRHRQQELARRLRLAAGDEQAERALARALRLLDDGPAVPATEHVPSVVTGTEPGAITEATVADEPEIAAEPEIATQPEVTAEFEVAAEPEIAPGSGVAEPAPAAGPPAATAPEAIAEPQAVAVPDAVGWPEPRAVTEPQVGLAPERVAAPEAITAPEAVAEPEPIAEPAAEEAPAAGPVVVTAGPSTTTRRVARPRGPDGEALSIAADEAARHGDAGGAVVAAMAAARAFRDAGHPVAALDVCIEALAVGPDEISLHLLIAELQAEQGWSALASETYRNLVRLAELDGDASARARVVEAARATLPNDPRFAGA